MAELRKPRIKLGSAIGLLGAAGVGVVIGRDPVSKGHLRPDGLRDCHEGLCAFQRSVSPDRGQAYADRPQASPHRRHAYLGRGHASSHGSHPSPGRGHACIARGHASSRRPHASSRRGEACLRPGQACGPRAEAFPRRAEASRRPGQGRRVVLQVRSHAWPAGPRYWQTYTGSAEGLQWRPGDIIGHARTDVSTQPVLHKDSVFLQSPDMMRLSAESV